MLGTIREFAAERLDSSGEGDAIRLRHAEFFLALARGLGLYVETIVTGVEQNHQGAVREAANLRAALAWSLESGHVALAASLAIALENFWVTQDAVEGMRWFSAILEREAELPAELLAPTVRCLGSSATIAGETRKGKDAATRALALYRERNDEFGVAVMLHRVGVAELQAGNDAEARELAEEALELDRKFDSKSGKAQAVSLIAQLEWREGRHERALELVQESIALAGESGFTWWEANMLGALAEWSLELDRIGEAERAVREELELRRTMNDQVGIVYGLSTAAVIAAKRGRQELAGRLWGAVEADEQRRPVLGWEELLTFVAPMLAAPTAEFEAARLAGARLTLDEAADLVLSAPDA